MTSLDNLDFYDNNDVQKNLMLSDSMFRIGVKQFGIHSATFIIQCISEPAGQMGSHSHFPKDTGPCLEVLEE